MHYDSNYSLLTLELHQPLYKKLQRDFNIYSLNRGILLFRRFE